MREPTVNDADREKARRLVAWGDVLLKHNHESAVNAVAQALAAERAATEERVRRETAEVVKAARAVPDAWDALDDALGHYFGEVGAEHEDDCPEDDTCDCPALVPMHAAEPKMRRAIQDLRDELRAGGAL